jgi:hypothetical protein
VIITKATPFTKEEIEKRNKIALGSISMDLNRVAIGYRRGSLRMAEIFLDSALKRKREIDLSSVKPYVKKLLVKLDIAKVEKDKEKMAEDMLMYGTLFQNAALAK